MKKTVLVLSALFVVTFAAMTLASAPVGVTPTLLGRGTYDTFKLRTPPQALVDLKLEAKNPWMSWCGFTATPSIRPRGGTRIPARC